MLYCTPCTWFSLWFGSFFLLPTIFFGVTEVWLYEESSFLTMMKCPIQVVRCCLEHAASVAKTFLTSDVVVVEIKEAEPAPLANPMDNSGTWPLLWPTFPGPSFIFCKPLLKWNMLLTVAAFVLWSPPGYGYWWMTVEFHQRRKSGAHQLFLVARIKFCLERSMM
jgi:hypothetical protein